MHSEEQEKSQGCHKVSVRKGRFLALTESWGLGSRQAGLTLNLSIPSHLQGPDRRDDAMRHVPGTGLLAPGGEV